MDTSKDKTTHKLQREAKTLLKQVMQSLDTTQHIILTIVLHSFRQSMQTHRKMSHHQTTKQREQNSQLGHTQYKEIPAYTQYSSTITLARCEHDSIIHPYNAFTTQQTISTTHQDQGLFHIRQFFFLPL